MLQTKKNNNIIEWFKNEKAASTKKGVVMELDKFEDQIVNRTFMVYNNILDKNINFCDRHREFKKQDIISQALAEFIEKYE